MPCEVGYKRFNQHASCQLLSEINLSHACSHATRRQFAHVYINRLQLSAVHVGAWKPAVAAPLAIPRTSIGIEMRTVDRPHADCTRIISVSPDGSVSSASAAAAGTNNSANIAQSRRQTCGETTRARFRRQRLIDVRECPLACRWAAHSGARRPTDYQRCANGATAANMTQSEYKSRRAISQWLTRDAATRCRVSLRVRSSAVHAKHLASNYIWRADRSQNERDADDIPMNNMVLIPCAVSGMLIEFEHKCNNSSRIHVHHILIDMLSDYYDYARWSTLDASIT